MGVGQVGSDLIHMLVHGRFRRRRFRPALVGAGPSGNFVLHVCSSVLTPFQGPSIYSPMQVGRVACSLCRVGVTLRIHEESVPRTR